MSAPLSSSQFYSYTPSAIAAAIFLALFTQSSALHAFQIARTRTFYFIPVAVGCLFEAIGYLCRLISHFESPVFGLPAFAIQSVFILVPPVLFFASIAIHLDRIMHLTEGESFSPVRPSRLTKIFLVSDCIGFVILIVGSALRLTDSASNIRLGNRLVMTGLGEQVLFILFSVFVAGTWHWRIRKHGTKRLADSTSQPGSPPIPYQIHLLALYASVGLIAIRSAVRLIETFLGTGGLVGSNEVFLYVFDAAFMFVLVVGFHFLHPSQINALIGSYHDRPLQSTKGGEEFCIPPSRAYFDGLNVLKRKYYAAA